MREVAGSISADSGHVFREIISGLNFPMDMSKVLIGKLGKSMLQVGKNTVRQSDYKEVSCVSITSEPVKDLTIKMGTTMMVTPTTSNIALLYEGV